MIDTDQQGIRSIFKDQCRMAAAAERSVQICSFSRRFQKTDDFFRQDREMMEVSH